VLRETGSVGIQAGWLAIVALLACVAGCTEESSNLGKSVTAKPTAPLSLDDWLGQWTGPEGTFLLLQGGNGHFQITIRNLDGPRTFTGVARGSQIEFERDGVKESLRATNGNDTGMKWLAGKSRCLTVRKGEGYCQD
jgi:hypothetical protein